MKIKNTEFSTIITDEALQRAAWGGDCSDPAGPRERSLKELGRTIAALSEEQIVRIFQNIGAGNTNRSLRKKLLWSTCHYVSPNDGEATKSADQIERIMTACSGALESIYVRKNGESKGQVKARLVMAEEYLFGDHVEKNERQGMALLQPLVDQDNSTAQLMLSMYLLKQGRGRDRERALGLLERASAHGDAEAMNILANEYLGKFIRDARGRHIGFSGTKIDEGVQLLIRSAALGDQYSTLQLGHMRLNGVGVPQDVREGFRLLSSLSQDLKDLTETEDLCLSTFRVRP